MNNSKTWSNHNKNHCYKYLPPNLLLKTVNNDNSDEMNLWNNFFPSSSSTGSLFDNYFGTNNQTSSRSSSISFEEEEKLRNIPSGPWLTPSPPPQTSIQKDNGKSMVVLLKDEDEIYDNNYELTNVSPTNELIPKKNATMLNVRRFSKEITSVPRVNVAPPPESIQRKSNQLPSSSMAITDQICTLYLDMTYDDRVFFGIHNFFLLKRSLTECQCNVDFSAPDNKVSIVGKFPSVIKMSKSFFLHSTFALQFEFYYYDECFEFLKEEFIRFQQECQKWDVHISYRQQKSNVLLFNFLSFRKYFIYLVQTIIHFQMRLEFYPLGKVLPNVMSTLQIPVSNINNRPNRNANIDSNTTATSNSSTMNNTFIEWIQNETNTKIKTIRYNDCPQYPFENVIITGTDLFSVVQARWLMTSRFVYELKFQLATEDTALLVKSISSLKYDRSSIDITIAPCILNCNDSKIVSIKSNENYLDQIFNLRQELLKLMTIGRQNESY